MLKRYTLFILFIFFVLGATWVFAGEPNPVVVLGPQPIRVVDGQTYVINIPPAETGIVATLVLSDDSDSWDAPVVVGDEMVYVPPQIAYEMYFKGVPGQDSQLFITRGHYPWSGGYEGYAWASVSFSSGKTVVAYQPHTQAVTRRLPKN